MVLMRKHIKIDGTALLAQARQTFQCAQILVIRCLYQKRSPCQSASKKDPLSACKRDPLRRAA
jgi:hypothetical protein